MPSSYSSARSTLRKLEAVAPPRRVDGLNAALD